MMVEIEFSSRYRRMFKELIGEQAELYDEVVWRVKRFRENQEDTRLKVHLLKRRLKGKWAFNIDDDVRILFEWKGKHKVRFLAIGGHDKVYR